MFWERALRVLPLLLWPARAQVYSLEGEAAPNARCMHGRYLFYVFSSDEAPGSGSEDPSVEFRNLKASVNGTRLPPEQAEQIQVVILPYRDFTKRIKTDDFCIAQLSPTENDPHGLIAAACDAKCVYAGGDATCRARIMWSAQNQHANDPDGCDVAQNQVASECDHCRACSAEQAGCLSKKTFSPKLDIQEDPSKSLSDINVFMADMARPLMQKRSKLNSTGAYLLIISNCGRSSNVTLSGSVVVRNKYGFLPGNEYHKMQFFGLMTIVYVCLALVWTSMVLARKNETVSIHFCIAFGIVLALLESALSFLSLYAWNVTGIRNQYVLAIVTMSSVTKSMCAYSLALVACLGWGVTIADLEQSTVNKIQCWSSVYTVLAFMREFTMSFRFTHKISMTFTVLSMIPVNISTLVIFLWIFFAVSALTTTLQKEQQIEKLALFRKFKGVMVFAASVGAVAAAFQLIVLPQDFSVYWHYQWLVSDGVSQALFLIVLVSIVILWAPNENSARYAFSSQLGKDGAYPEPEGIDEVDEMGATTIGKHAGTDE